MPDATDGGRSYAGAGDGQCLAVKDSDGERCTNGVYGSNDFCGTHKRADDVTSAIEAATEGAKWVRCQECGWQKAQWDGPDPPSCAYCSVRINRPDYEIRESGDNKPVTDDWDPEPADLREGETPDDWSHAARNAEQLAMADDSGGDDDA